MTQSEEYDYEGDVNPVAVVEEIGVLPVSNDYLEQVVGLQERNAKVLINRPAKKDRRPMWRKP